MLHRGHAVERLNNMFKTVSEIMSREHQMNVKQMYRNFNISDT